MAVRSPEPAYCHLCGLTENLKRCAGCSRAWYCSKEHQVKHWAAHKHVCQTPRNNQQFPQAENQESASSMTEDELQSIVDDLCNNQTQWIDSLTKQLYIPPPDVSWLEQRSLRVINDMNRFGICVVDNFLGADRANEIYTEVLKLYQQRSLFQRGQVVNQAASANVLVRGDHIAWLDGTETSCSSIRFMIRTLDSIVAKCVNHQSSGEMSLYRITQRTKAMLACYPGGGSRYYKHVDNPNFDGRKITCIYYINKNWNGDQDGGVLRIYPENHPEHVAKVEPLLDRLVLFWSDRRNPHEVLPSQRIRFAITVWYLDDNEIAMQSCLQANVQPTRAQPLIPFPYGVA